MSDKINSFPTFENKLNYFIANPFLSLLVIGLIGLIIRLFYFPYEIPLILDAFAYFLFANDTVILGQLPNTYTFGNDGWSAFLGMMFSLVPFHDWLELMYFQRAISILFSILTIIPIYILCSNYVDKRIAIVASAIFVLEPRIILNSLQGITEPLFIFLITCSFVLFLNKIRNLSIYLLS